MRRQTARVLALVLCAALCIAGLPGTMARGEQTAVVNNPDPQERLNLRASASTKAASLGKYYNGVRVAVLGTEGEWSRVRIEGTGSVVTGYMLTKFLAVGGAGDSVASVIPLGMVSPENEGSRVHLREGASDKAVALGNYGKGQVVEVLGIAGDWLHVRVDGQIGYMRGRMINLTGTTGAVPEAVPQAASFSNLPAYAVVSPVNGGLTAELREGASADTALLGDYYGGVRVWVMDVAGQWARVCIGGGTDQSGSVYGYMLASNLIQEGDNTHIAIKTPIVRVRPQNGEAAILREAASESAPALGEYPAGVLLIQLAKAGAWLHVTDGKSYGYLLAASTEATELASETYLRLPVQGYGFANMPERGDGYTASAKILSFPARNAASVGELYSGYSVQLLADLGDWVQVWHKWDAVVGFMKAESVKPFWLSSLIVAEGTPAMGPGTYRVGRDIPAGLYTLSLAEGEKGGLEATSAQSPLYHLVEWTGAASYTLYLPDGADVTVRGGTLAPMKEQSVPTWEEHLRLEGTGRFFVGTQLSKDDFYSTVTISLMPGQKTGYYAISDLSTDDGTGKRPVRYRLEEGEEQYVWLLEGQFIEIRNCVMEVELGHG